MLSNQLNLLSPVSGMVLPLEKVPDPVFSQKIVGDGIAIDPTSQVLLAPCAGTVVQLHSSHHALTILTAGGNQVLLHIGLDTVQLKGDGFHPLVKVGDRVAAQQPLIQFDADRIALAGKSLMTIMVVTGEAAVQQFPRSLAIAGRDVLLSFTDGVANNATATTTATSNCAESNEFQVQLPTGLHARPAALLVNLAKSFQSKIELLSEKKTGNAKSVVSLLSMEIANGENLRFVAEGPDASIAVSKLALFLEELREAAPTHSTVAQPVTAKRVSTDPNLLVGVAISPGIAIGQIRQIRGTSLTLDEDAAGTPQEETARLHSAISASVLDLRTLSEKVKAETDASRAAIFSAHQELLEDPGILEAAQTGISQGQSAAYAWNAAIHSQAAKLSQLNNELMANRANDLLDAGGRVLAHLVGQSPSALADLPAGSILIAENLTPSQTALINREKILAFATVSGGATSHVAILARSLGLPALAGMDPRLLKLTEGSEVILDGDLGEMRLHPAEADKNSALERQREQLEKRKIALTESHNEANTLDGTLIEVAANIGSLADAREALSSGADGIGLLRSEFLFLDRDSAPTEDEQLMIYQQIADLWPGKVFVIRTLDVGGDKPLDYLPMPAEENPFLGIRGIRIGLKHEPILRTQLRAILRVKSSAKIHIMFPMIATLEEWRRAKAILEEERVKLGAAPVRAGIMIEVPSAALLAEEFAREVDFFSIGTNDLTQYTLAMDRGHKELAKQADALHPSVLKLIEITCRAAKKHGRWVGVCGGLAGESKAVPILIGLGVGELSVSIPSIPLIKAQVREISLSNAQTLAQVAVISPTADAVRSLNINAIDQRGLGHGDSQIGLHVSAENR